jgi:type III restriction enzyme
VLFRSDEPIFPTFDDGAHLALNADDVATWVQMQGQAGETDEITTDDIVNARPQQVAYKLAEGVMARMFNSEQGDRRNWYFPQVVTICKQWLKECLTLPAGSTTGVLLLSQYRQRAIDKIEGTIRHQFGNQQQILRPRFDTFYPEASTDVVDFPTRKVVIEATKSPINYVVLDGPKGNTWEEALAYYLEHDDRVASYVKNDHLDFTIPYVFQGVAHEFWPDFIVRLKPTAADPTARTLIVEVSGGRKDQDKREAKAHTARHSWCVAVNNHGGYGRWGFVELADITKLQPVMDHAINDLYADGVTTGGSDL